MRLMTNEELLAVSGSGCSDTVVANVTTAMSKGFKDVTADMKATKDIADCLSKITIGVEAINKVTDFISDSIKQSKELEKDIDRDIMLTNKNLDTFDPPTGSGGGNGKQNAFEVNEDTE